MMIVRPAWRVGKAVGLIVVYWYAAVLAFLLIVVALVAFGERSDREDVLARQAAAARKRDRFVANIEGDPRRLPMRADLTMPQRKQCEAIWLTAGGRTTRLPDGTFQGFPDDITVGTPHPPECY